MRSRRSTIAVCFGVALPSLMVSFAQEPMPAVLQNYSPVTAERLKNPEESNWLMNRRTYDGWGYSPLNQITPDNVTRLRPVWVFSTNDGKPHESAPLVNNGVMFVTSPANQVLAIDVRTGNLLWRYKQSRPPGASTVIFNDTNRGVALYQDKVFSRCLRPFWWPSTPRRARRFGATTIADYKTGYYMTLAPMVADGKVMVGASGGESGIRGFSRLSRSGHRQGAVADLHHSSARRTGKRDLAERRRPMEDTAGPRFGSQAITTRRPILPTGAPETPAPTSAISAPATICTVVRPS